MYVLPTHIKPTGSRNAGYYVCLRELPQARGRLAEHGSMAMFAIPSGMRTPFAVMAVLFVALLGVALLTGSEDEAPARPAPAPVSVIARRVEALRELRFKAIPKPVPVSAATARREGLADFDKQYPAARRRADETVYKLLGLIAPDQDLRTLTGSLFEQGVLGYYDPTDGRLRVVRGGGTGTRVLWEMTLAHELTHALEDEQFSFPDENVGGDDRSLARTAVIEGTATWMMYAYVQRHFSSEETLGSLLGAAFEDTGDLPPFLEAQVIFPYISGEAFVEDLRARANGGWDLVNTAFRLHMPSSTEQILHPTAYFEADEPKPVRIRNVLGWQRAANGTWGELQTRELLAGAGGNSSDAAAGWGGDRYELWESGGHDVLVMRWRWDTARDETEFAAALREWAQSELDDPHAVTRRGGAVTLIVAPNDRILRRVAAGA
jgi:hypothetical protein